MTWIELTNSDFLNEIRVDRLHLRHPRAIRPVKS